MGMKALDGRGSDAALGRRRSRVRRMVAEAAVPRRLRRRRRGNRFHLGDELMMDRLIRLQPALRIPLQTARDEIQKHLVIALQDLPQRLRARAPTLALARDDGPGFAERVEKELLARRLLDQVLVRRAEDLHDAGQLLLLVLAGEDGVARQELGEDAAQRPHVDGQAVRHAEDDFGRAVEARLDVRVHLLVLEAGGAKVDDFDFRVRRVGEQDVFRFEVAVDHALTFEQDEAVEDLFGEAAHELEGEAGVIV